MKRQLIAKECYKLFKNTKLELREGSTDYYVKVLKYNKNTYIRRSKIGDISEYCANIDVWKEGKMKYELKVYGYNKEDMTEYSGKQYVEHGDMVLQSEIFEKGRIRKVSTYISDEDIVKLVELSK